jgi:ADP-heptose:LPS heptosyltransferase
MRARRFDAWIELPAVAAKFSMLVRNMLVARLAGARWGYGWRYERMHLFARAQSEVIDFPDEVTRLLALLDAGAVAPAAEAEFPLGIGAAERARAGALLAAAGIGPLIAMAPGAKRAPNRWPAERFIAVGRHLAERGFALALLGGSGDAEICGSIADALGPCATNLAGRLTLRETCALLERAALLVCNDSGVQHLAAATGTPCVSIFSCRDFRGKWYPHGAMHTVLRKSVACHTCFLDECPYDNRCINLVTAGAVAAAADFALRDAEAANAMGGEFMRGGDMVAR